ncbi:MAG: catalase [Oscillospiraceae bacterium]|nr:catalase [Oscillospiraceae bacterium]
MTVVHPVAHFRTITEHRHLVCRYCLRLGLVWQGLTHDLSKYFPEEFWRGAKYYQGFRSPNDAERMETGVSRAWLHHKGRNKHHFEYWVDYILTPDHSVCYAGNKMPMRYVAEMFCDRLAACRIYLKDRYTDAAAYEYFMRSRDRIPIHPETGAELEKMLEVLKDEGEDAAFRYVRKRLKESR